MSSYGVRRFGGGQPAIHLGLQFRLAFLHALVAHGFVFGGIRLDFGSIEGDMTELHEPRFFRKLQDL